MNELNTVLAEQKKRADALVTGLGEVARVQGVLSQQQIAQIRNMRPGDPGAEDVVAFGDMPNDIPMLLWAGHGVAMGNAHSDAVAAADEVTAGNDDDGVARVLERWWL
jgi:hydroxymethylpyrimidine pyrophosphatase-like HAD family hydrolase